MEVERRAEWPFCGHPEVWRLPPRQMPSLSETAQQHEEVILSHLERLPALADMVLDGATEALQSGFQEECRFITGQLVPHIEAVEAALYPELQEQLKHLHSLAPMRREHRDLTKLLALLCRYREDLEAGRLTPAKRVALRRTLYRLYTVFKVHLAQERLFVGVLERALPGAQKDALSRALSHRTLEPTPARPA